MFCSKCGNENEDTSNFCKGCGENINQITTPSKINKEKKKIGKGKILSIIMGVIAVVVIISLISSDSSYITTVKTLKPFEDFDFTVADVLDTYIVESEWSEYESKGEHFVDIKGNAKNSKDQLIVTFKVTPVNSSKASIKPYSLFINDKMLDENKTIEFLYTAFSYYDEGFEDISDLTDIYSVIAINNSADTQTLDSHIVEAQAETTLGEKAYFVQLSENVSDEYCPTLVLFPDGSCYFLANMYEAMSTYAGSYTIDNGIYYFYVDNGFSEISFSMENYGDTLVYTSEDAIGMTFPNSEFYLSTTIPESLINLE